MRKDIVRGGERSKNGVGYNLSEASQENATEKGEQQSCMYGTSDALVVPFTQKVSNHNIGSDGQTYKKIDEEINDRGTGSDSSQCRMSGKLADDGYVGGIE